MKWKLIRVLALSSAMAILAGCAWQVGGGAKRVTVEPTLGQQLIDLQKAKDSGALTEAEYQAQKAKLLGSK
jgi:outer membrane biogenesis lipoprotein LolB